MPDPNTIYLHEAMNQTNRKDFITTILKAVTDQMVNGNYSIITKSQVPTGATILLVVCQMERKQDIKTRYINKRKARLIIYGSRMKNGIQYEHIFMLVAYWYSIRFILALSSIHKWKIVQLDYVL